MSKVAKYLKGTKAEMAHVKWPTQKEIVSYTVVVIAISLLIAGMLGLFDLLLIEFIQTIS